MGFQRQDGVVLRREDMPVPAIGYCRLSEAIQIDVEVNHSDDLERMQMREHVRHPLLESVPVWQ